MASAKLVTVALDKGRLEVLASRCSAVFLGLSLVPATETLEEATIFSRGG